MLTGELKRRNFAGMSRKWTHILSGLFGRRYYLLTDGTHSCVYVPKRTYRRLTRLLERSLERDPKAENSLRFVWTRCGGEWLLIVNPSKDAVPMNCTHGLTRDSDGRILIPCPYVQQIYARFGIEPEWCGRMEAAFKPTRGKAVAAMELKDKRQGNA